MVPALHILIGHVHPSDSIRCISDSCNRLQIAIWRGSSGIRAGDGYFFITAAMRAFTSGLDSTLI